MCAAAKSFFRYFLSDSKDRDWGIHATSAGYVDIEPGEAYPPTGHPKHYAFDWESGRKLDEVQIHFITRGEGVFESPQGTIPLAAGNAFVLFPQVWHRYAPKPQTGWLEYWIGLKGDYLNRLLERGFFTPEHSVFTPVETDPLLRLFTEAVSCMRHHPVGTPRLLGSLAGLIMAELQVGTVAVEPNRNRTETVVHETKHMLRQHLEQELDLELLARKMKVGYHWLRRAFKQETGQSLHQYRLQIRLSRAMQLLKQTDATVEQIALQTGFEGSSYFSQIFKRKVGCPPGEWRSAESRRTPAV
jgi:AraC-like DNA-binding protein